MAFALFTFFFSSNFTLSQANRTLSQTLSEQFEAVSLANLEISNALEKDDITLTHSTSEDNFTVATKTTWQTPCFRNITTDVSWGENARRHSFTASTSQALIKRQAQLGRDCAFYRLPDLAITQPKIHNPLNNNLTFTDMDILQNVGMNIFCIGSLQAGQNDLWILTEQNGKLEITASLETGSGIKALDAVWVADKALIFTANYQDKNQLQVLNMTDPKKPVLLGQYTLPKVGNSYPQGFSIKYFDGYVYIGTRETAGPELHVYKVNNQGQLTHTNEKEINHNVHGLEVDENYIYLATSADKEEVQVRDHELQLIQTINLGGSKAGESDATFIQKLGAQLLVGKNRLTQASEMASLVTFNETTSPIQEIKKTKDEFIDTNTGLQVGDESILGGTSKTGGFIRSATTGLATPKPVIKLELSTVGLFGLMENGEIWQW